MLIAKVKKDEPKQI